ncbi:MAG: glycosyl transferase [Elainellaceae cyanobacterium]
MSPIVYIAITDHGFGHATRMAAVAAEIQRLKPDVTLILATTAPRWLLESYITGDFIHRPRGFDVGVVQSDSVTMDKPATLAKLQQIRDRQAAVVASEAGFLKQNRVSLVLADIPPLAAPIAQRAGVPCWMVSNFGWDFIYRAWGGEFTAIADWIADCFGQCDRLFRLPFHESMSAFPLMEDVGLTGGTPRWSEPELRQRFDLNPAAEKTVLLTFGGLGLAQIPYDGLQRFEGWQFITFDRTAPDLPNLLKVIDRGYRPVDMMPLCDCIVGKPGYSTFSEACLNDVPIISITRDGFAEAPILIEGIKQVSYHHIISPEHLMDGSWSFLEESLMPPATQIVLPKTGNQAIAQAVVEAC